MNKKILLSLAAISMLSSVNAMEFKPVGFKAVGMGGAGVASTRGAYAGYYNPAMLRFSDYTTEVALGVSARVRETNLIDNMDQLNNIDFQNTIDTLSDNAEASNLSVESQIKNNILTTAERDYNLPPNSSTFFNNLPNGSTVKLSDLDPTITANSSADITFEKDGDKLIYTKTGTANNIEANKNLNTAIDIITNKIGTQNALMISVTPTFALQATDKFALGLYGNADVSLRLNVDSNYNKLITKQQNDSGTDLYYQYDSEAKNGAGEYKVIMVDTNSTQAYETTSLEYANNGNVNYVQVDSQVFSELPLSYAHLFDTNYGSWSIGGSIKPMSLKSYTKTVLLGADSNDASDNIDDYETSYDSTVGLDLGFAFRPTDSQATFALVAKNINTPTFKVNESQTGVTQDYEIKPMVRAGLSYPLWNDNIEFALDVDLTKNETSIEGEDSQLVGGGIELHPASWFSFRLGAMQDMASKRFDDGTILTSGFGLGLKWLQVDFSAMVSTNKGEYDGNQIPRYTAANLSIISKWGDGYNRKKAPLTKARPLNKELSESEKNRIKADATKAQEELNKSPY